MAKNKLKDFMSSFVLGNKEEEEAEYVTSTHDQLYSDYKKEVQEQEYAMDHEQEEPYVKSSVRAIENGDERLKMYSNSNLVVHIVKPTLFEDSRELIDALKAGKVVNLNIADLDKALSEKILNFCLGGCYAVNGKIKQTSRGMFIFTPEFVDITTDMDQDTNEDDDYDFDDEIDINPWSRR